MKDYNWREIVSQAKDLGFVLASFKGTGLELPVGNAELVKISQEVSSREILADGGQRISDHIRHYASVETRSFKVFNEQTISALGIDSFNVTFLYGLLRKRGGNVCANLGWGDKHFFSFNLDLEGKVARHCVPVSYQVYGE